MKIAVLYEDAHLVVADKPSGSVVHPTRGARGALVIVRALAGQIHGAVYPVHRLDRQTSGALLLARSPEAAAALCTEIREGRFKKSYLALCRGVVRDSMRIDSPLSDGDESRPACTDVEPLEHFCDRYTLLRVRPLTGRSHQIRRHLKRVNHPLVVDATYGSGTLNRFFRETMGLDRLFLHAESLRVLHPVELRHVEVGSPLPPELEEVLGRLRTYDGPVV
ncbi:MAG: RluA family pseudouridine synthase [Candidatus Riflebacteria bacterium]|nr:RluA family pseudouridine synthase [Candidatus Riflebacteria bacterium]